MARWKASPAPWAATARCTRSGAQTASCSSRCRAMAAGRSLPRAISCRPGPRCFNYRPFRAPTGFRRLRWTGAPASPGLLSQVAVDEDGRTYAGMGVDFDDFNNDGLPDLVVDNLADQMYAVYRSEEEHTSELQS